MLVAAVFFSEPKIGNAFEFGQFALNQIAVKIRLNLIAAGAAVSVVKSTLQEQPVVRFVHEELTTGLSIVERFGVVGVGRREDDKSHIVASVAATAAIIFAVDDVEGVARGQHRAALVVLGIAHGDEVARINRHEKLEVDLAGGKFVGELSKEFLELGAGRIVGDAEGIADSLENSATLFSRSIGKGSKLIDSVDVFFGFVIGSREEADSAFNQSEFIAIGVQLDGAKNGISEIVNEKIVRGIVFNLRGFGLHDFIGMAVGFGVVVGGDSEAVKISIFDSHSLRLGDAFIAGILPGTETLESKSFAGFAVNKRDDNFNGGKLFDVAFGSGDLFEHVSGSCVFILMEVVSSV